MKKKAKKINKDDYRFLNLYLEDLADLYKEDRIDDNSILDFVSKELKRLEENKKGQFKIDFLDFMSKDLE